MIPNARNDPVYIIMTWSNSDSIDELYLKYSKHWAFKLRGFPRRGYDDLQPLYHHLQISRQHSVWWFNSTSGLGSFKNRGYKYKSWFYQHVYIWCLQTFSPLLSFPFSFLLHLYYPSFHLWRRNGSKSAIFTETSLHRISSPIFNKVCDVRIEGLEGYIIM